MLQSSRRQPSSSASMELLPPPHVSQVNLTPKQRERRINELERINFDMKIRLFFLEERLASCSQAGDQMDCQYLIVDLEQRLKQKVQECEESVAAANQWREIAEDAHTELWNAVINLTCQKELLHRKSELCTIEETLSNRCHSRILQLEMDLRRAQESLEKNKVGALKEVEAALREVLQPMKNYGTDAEALDIAHVLVKNGEPEYNETPDPSTLDSQVLQRKKTSDACSKTSCKDFEVSELEHGLPQVFQDEAATTLRGQVTHLEKNLQEAGKIREDKWVNVHGAAELEAEDLFPRLDGEADSLEKQPSKNALTRIEAETALAVTTPVPPKSMNEKHAYNENEFTSCRVAPANKRIVTTSTPVNGEDHHGLGSSSQILQSQEYWQSVIDKTMAEIQSELSFVQPPSVNEKDAEMPYREISLDADSCI